MMMMMMMMRSTLIAHDSINLNVCDGGGIGRSSSNCSSSNCSSSSSSSNVEVVVAVLFFRRLDHG